MLSVNMARGDDCWKSQRIVVKKVTGKLIDGFFCRRSPKENLPEVFSDGCWQSRLVALAVADAYWEELNT